MNVSEGAFVMVSADLRLLSLFSAASFPISGLLFLCASDGADDVLKSNVAEIARASRFEMEMHLF